MVIDEKNLEEIKQILKRLIPDCEVRAFGSRVSGKSKPTSDLDLVIIHEEPLATQMRILLKEAFEDSRISFRIDFIEWIKVSSSFQAMIKDQMEIIQQAS